MNLTRRPPSRNCPTSKINHTRPLKPLAWGPLRYPLHINLTTILHEYVPGHILNDTLSKFYKVTRGLTGTRIDDEASFKAEVQKAKGACTQDKETAMDHKQYRHIRNYLPQSSATIDKEVLKGKLAIYDVGHDHGHLSMIRVIAFNVVLEFNLDSNSSVNLDPRTPDFKDNILAIGTKHNQAIWIHLHKKASTKQHSTEVENLLELIQSVETTGWLSLTTIHTNNPTDSEYIVFITKKFHGKLINMNASN